MHAFLVWLHIGFMIVAFAASPLGRLGLRYLLSRVPGPESAEPILRGFNTIFTVGGIAVTLGVVSGLVLASSGSLYQFWIVASLVLITIAGVAGVLLENRWIGRLRRAEGGAFATVLHERIPLAAAWISPAIWLSILWLMVEKPL